MPRAAITRWRESPLRGTPQPSPSPPVATQGGDSPEPLSASRRGQLKLLVPLWSAQAATNGDVCAATRFNLAAAWAGHALAGAASNVGTWLLGRPGRVGAPEAPSIAHARSAAVLAPLVTGGRQRPAVHVPPTRQRAAPPSLVYRAARFLRCFPPRPVYCLPTLRLGSRFWRCIRRRRRLPVQPTLLREWVVAHLRYLPMPSSSRARCS